MIRRPPRSTPLYSSAASDVYKRQANIHTAPILVDSNILLDVISSDPQWGEWSRSRLSEATEYSSLAINPVIYAEVSVGIARIEEMEELLPRDYFRRLPLPWEAAFLAGKAFLRYRRNSGSRKPPLPDFFIGAHAAVTGMRLLTRDPTRYATYFPAVELIAP